jgi:hypothetical protein
MLAENSKLTYSLIYGQCSNALWAKLESRPNHAAIEGAAIGLLENVRMVMFQFQLQQYSPVALHKVQCRFYLFSHDQNMTCQQYHETFCNNVNMLEYCGSVIAQQGHRPGGW